MSYAAPPRRSSAGMVIVVIILLGLVFLFGLVVAGAVTYSFARAERQQVRAVAARETAVRQVDEARRLAELHRADAEHRPNDMLAEKSVEGMPSFELGPPAVVTQAEPAPGRQSIRVAQREITVQLDETGKINVDGTACELPQFKEMLAQAVKGREDAIILSVQADKRCLFEHVAAVLTVCKDLDVPHVRISALEERRRDTDTTRPSS